MTATITTSIIPRDADSTNMTVKSFDDMFVPKFFMANNSSLRITNIVIDAVERYHGNSVFVASTVNLYIRAVV